MSIIRRLILPALFLSCLFSLPVLAQVSAALSGRVTDRSGAVIQGATVTAKDTDTGVARTTITDADGRYDCRADGNAIWSRFFSRLEA